MIRVYAPAKLTLSLRVLGRRADGFHDIEALTVPITEPHDIVEVTPAPTTMLTVGGPFASGVPTDETNLASRAARATGRTLAIRVTKGIPVGAGLGGGSADAAAVLLAALDGDRVRALEVAASLGSDVPFCVHGRAAWMRGRGEVLEPAKLPELAVVVVVPPFGCATPAVYAAWDELGGPVGAQVEVPGVGLPPLANDLEIAAVHVEPRLAALRADIEAVTRRSAILAGSGSSYAVVYADREEAAVTRERLADRIAGSTFVGITCPAGGAASGSS